MKKNLIYISLFITFTFTSTLALSFNEVIEGKNYILLGGKKADAPSALLIIVQGAKINPYEYYDLAKTIQDSSNLNLWVGVSKMIKDIPNPAQINSVFSNIIQKTDELNRGKISKENIFIAGHSLGGITSIDVAKKNGFAGLILLASYLPKSKLTGYHRLKDFPIPVLTLGGELDGQTRLPWIAREYKDYLELKGESKYRKPVIILPGVNHYQFSSGKKMESDIPSDISTRKAHYLISDVINSFISLNTSPDQIDSTEIQNSQIAIDKALKTTDRILSGYLKSEELDNSICSDAQKNSSGIDPIDFNDIVVTSTKHTNKNSFMFSKPKNIETESEIKTHYILERKDNHLDISNTQYSPRTLACKMKTQESISIAFGLTPEREAASCEEINRKTVEKAKELLTQEQLDRFNYSRREILTEEDKAFRTGISWITAPMEYSTENYDLIVTSTSLETTEEANDRFKGMKYCKLIPLSMALEWMLTDALRD